MADDTEERADPTRLAMTKPRSLSLLADAILGRLSRHPESAEIVLGGYFALQHYANYRQTHDIDAWWRSQASKTAEDAIRTVMTEVAQEQGFALRERRFGDTASFEFLEGAAKRFSFQISIRSVTLEEPSASAWPPILIETMRENVASKMNALVHRGAPRDFLDIRHVCKEGLVTTSLCWDLWRRKNPEGALESAKQNVLLHLKRLEARRPLDSISDPHQKGQALALREWYRIVFLK